MKVSNMITGLLFGTISLILIFSGSTLFADHHYPKQAFLPQEMAQKIAETALQKCRKDGYTVSVTVVDQSGVLKVLLRDDGAGPHTIGSSSGKAYTAASLKRSTSGLAEFIKDKPALHGLRDMDDRILILGGGLPITIAGQVVGGIGVGGAPGGHLDEACANAGIISMDTK